MKRNYRTFARTQMSSIALRVCWTAEIHRRDRNDCTFLVVMKVKGRRRGEDWGAERKLHRADYTTPQLQTRHNKCAIKHNNTPCWALGFGECATVRVSPNTHRHCCVAVVGPEMEPPGGGSVPWSPSPHAQPLEWPRGSCCTCCSSSDLPSPPSQLSASPPSVSTSHLLRCHSLCSLNTQSP